MVTLIAVDPCLVKISGQMPDWVLLRGVDGSKMYMDRAGKLHTMEIPVFKPEPISTEGLEYHFTRGRELIAGQNKPEGLRIMKSIMALSQNTGRLPDFKRKASHEINLLIRNEGDRFEKLNEQAALYLVRDGKAVFLYNDVMRYRIPVQGSVDVIRWRSRKGNGYRYYGVLLGIRFNRDGAAGEKGYDCLTGIDSEVFPHPPGTLSKIEHHWRNILGADTFIRTETFSGEFRKIYEFSDRQAPNYSGFEAFMLRGKYGYCVRILSSKPVFERNKENLLRLAEAIEMM